MMIQVICPERHTGRWTSLEADDLGLTIAGNGSYQVRPYCSECGRWATGSVPLATLRAVDVDPASLPLIADYRGTLGRCSHRGCEREAVEDHHFAPRAIFGDDADDWPRALLCVDHHTEWHRRMAAAAQARSAA